MAAPRVLILRAPGTNCDAETAHAFALAGAVAEEWHVNRLLEAPRRLADFQIFCVPGGFSYGDDLSAGRIFGSKMCNNLAGPLSDFRSAGKLVLGVCNGFQVLLKTNLLAAPDANGPTATLAFNDSGHFEARWVRLAVSPGNCVFLQGIEEIELPVAHAEGRFVARDATVLAQWKSSGRLVMRYRASAECGMPSAESKAQPQTQRPQPAIAAVPPPAVPYPDNPNGAMANVAGICDETGRVFGLMPHPERFVESTQHPRWTRGSTREAKREAGAGLRVFQNAVRYFS